MKERWRERDGEDKSHRVYCCKLEDSPSLWIATWCSGSASMNSVVNWPPSTGKAFASSFDEPSSALAVVPVEASGRLCPHSKYGAACGVICCLRDLQSRRHKVELHEELSQHSPPRTSLHFGLTFEAECRLMNFQRFAAPVLSGEYTQQGL